MCEPDWQDRKLNKWFESLKSGKGLCCDGKGAVHVADPDWVTRNGHYSVRIDVSSEMGKVDMEWIDVPDEAVITEPNLSGHTLVQGASRRYHPLLHARDDDLNSIALRREVR